MRQERRGKRGGLVLSLVLSLVAALFALAGCKSRTLVGQEQSCEVSGGLLAEERAACTGSVDAVRGEPQLVIVDTDGELDGTYRLDLAGRAAPDLRRRRGRR